MALLDKFKYIFFVRCALCKENDQLNLFFCDYQQKLNKIQHFIETFLSALVSTVAIMSDMR